MQYKKVLHFTLINIVFYSKGHRIYAKLFNFYFVKYYYLATNNKPIQMEVFIAAKFEIGASTCCKTSEFHHGYQHYFSYSQSIDVKDALKAVCCGSDDVCNSELSMDKAASSVSM
jgi:hypothetical protein